ncbi:uncharacterized protein [Eucyclogobius newberryi]|uniref:uncharacterized protein n=1 Tax=Eucyclogobius newberryi TaxID=166745 RepID=UPI003B59D67A
MSAGQTLRVLVNARLTAAAEEIFALFERTTAEFEEELRRSREENQRKQELLDSVLSPRVALLRADLRTTESPGPGLDQGLNQDLDLESEEQLVKQEEQLLQIAVQESSAVCVKKEESTVFHQAEDEEETRGKNNEEIHLHPQTKGGSSDTDNDDDWSAPFSCSGAPMENEAGSNLHDQVQIRTNSEPSLKQNALECSFCKRIFLRKSHLEIHIRKHTEGSELFQEPSLKVLKAKE